MKCNRPQGRFLLFSLLGLFLSNPSVAAPDFDKLQNKAFGTKKTKGLQHLNALWAAAYSLKSWEFPIHPKSSLKKPAPIVVTLDGKKWVLAFTDGKRLQALLKKQGWANKKSPGLFLSMTPLKGKLWLERLGKLGIHGVRFNEGKYGWFSPIVQLEPIYKHLKRLKLIKK
jgi:hypothetical protein